MKKLLVILFILITVQSHAQWLDSIKVVNKTTLTPFIHSTDTIGIRTWGYLSGTGWAIDTTIIAVNGNTIEVTISTCFSGSISFPQVYKFNVNMKTNPLPEGNYTAKVKIYSYAAYNSVPCSTLIARDSLSQSFIISDVASVKDNSINDFIILFPNPTTDKLNILFNSISSPCDMSIVDVLGQIVIEMKNKSTNQEIDISHLPKGVYFLNILSKDKRKTYKIIKE